MTPEQIKKIRLALNLSQRDFASALHLADTSGRVVVSRWERGHRIPSGITEIAIKAIAREKLSESKLKKILRS